MSINSYDPETGEIVTLASGVRMWIGTQSAHDTAVANGTMLNNVMVCITDDYNTDEEITLTATENTHIDGQKCWKCGNLVILQVRITITNTITTPNSFVLATGAPIPTSEGGNRTMGSSVCRAVSKTGVTWISNNSTEFRAGFYEIDSIPVGANITASITYTID